MALRSLSTAALRRELARREKGAAKLQRKHNKLTKALAKLESELAGLGGNSIAGGKRRGRPPGSKNKKRRGRKAGRRGRKLPKNKFNLGDSLAAAIKAGTTVSPAEAIKKVKAAGYKTISKAFNVSVSQTLAKDKRFKKQARGQYVRVSG